MSSDKVFTMSFKTLFRIKFRKVELVVRYDGRLQLTKVSIEVLDTKFK